MNVNSQFSEDSSTSMEVNSTASSSQSSTPNSRQNEESDKKVGFFHFTSSSSSDNSLEDKNQNNPHDDVIRRKPDRIITAGTIAEALKQLQQIEEEEERERKLSNPRKPSTDENSTEHMPTRLHRFFDASATNNTDNNENRRKLSLSKNVRKLTLTTTLTVNIETSTTENDVFDDKSVDNKSSTEISSTLLAIRREKEALVSDILQKIVDLRDLQLVEMSYRVRQRALASKFPSYVMKDFPSLYGRCFNLSMNMKILTQCQYGDSAIAARVLSDFDILEKSLEAKLPHQHQQQSDLSSMLHQIKL